VNLYRKRLVRTQQSEQYALFDLEQMDEELNPASIGKLDLHFTADGTYGTLLIWQEVAAGWDAARRQFVLDALLTELGTTMGLSADYAIEVFTPALGDYALESNMQE